MLQMMLNEDKTAVEMTFIDFFTKKQQYKTSFQPEEAEAMGRDLIEMAKEIKKNAKS